MLDDKEIINYTFNKNILAHIFYFCELSDFIRFRYLSAEVNQNVKFVILEARSKILRSKKTSQAEFLFTSLFYSLYGIYNESDLIFIVRKHLRDFEALKDKQEKKKLILKVYDVLTNMPQLYQDYPNFYRVSVCKLFEFIVVENWYLKHHINKIAEFSCKSKEHKQIFLQILEQYIQFPSKNVNYKEFISYMNRLRGKVTFLKIKTIKNQSHEALQL